jgi:hypothetical protein
MGRERRKLGPGRERVRRGPLDRGLADSAYEHNRDTWILTAVNLVGSQWPVLRFHDRFELGAGTPLPGGLAGRLVLDAALRLLPGVADERGGAAGGPLGWKAQSNLRIRFRLVADNNAATTGDGWNIDALSVAEHAPLALALPFREGFEAGLSNWLAAAWRTETNQSYEGAAAVRSASDSAYRVQGDYYGPDTRIHLPWPGRWTSRGWRTRRPASG